MLWVLIRRASVRPFLWVPQHKFSWRNKKYINSFCVVVCCFFLWKAYLKLCVLAFFEKMQMNCFFNQSVLIFSYFSIKYTVLTSVLAVDNSSSNVETRSRATRNRSRTWNGNDAKWYSKLKGQRSRPPKLINSKIWYPCVMGKIAQWFEKYHEERNCWTDADTNKICTENKMSTSHMVGWLVCESNQHFQPSQSFYGHVEPDLRHGSGGEHD